jgi:phosphatidylglycerophosphate synthase
VVARSPRWLSFVPTALVVLRALCGPVLLGAVAGGAGPWVLVTLLTVAFLSDVFDGIIARRLGVATALLRRADSIVDTGFYVCATVALIWRSPAVIKAHVPGLVALASLELARWAVERLRYGRLASYHMWSAKVWGVALWLGFSEAFLTGRPGPLLQAAIVTGILADAEGLATSLVLSTWQHDVATIWHAAQIERRRSHGGPRASARPNGAGA